MNMPDDGIMFGATGVLIALALGVGFFLGETIMLTKMRSLAEDRKLSENDKAWLLQQMGYIATVLAYQTSFEMGKRTETILDELPECQRLRVTMRRTIEE